MSEDRNSVRAIRPVSVRLPDDLAAQLAEASVRRGVGITEFIREASCSGSRSKPSPTLPARTWTRSSSRRCARSARTGPRDPTRPGATSTWRCVDETRDHRDEDELGRFIAGPTSPAFWRGVVELQLFRLREANAALAAHDWPSQYPSAARDGFTDANLWVAGSRHAEALLLLTAV